MNLIKSFIFLFPIIFLSLCSYADGGSMSGGGGGNGVICFHTNEETKSSFNANGNLNSLDRSNFKSIETLDIWEYRLTTPLFHPINGESPQNFLRRILQDKWKPIFPVLVTNLLLQFPMIEESELRSHPSDISHEIADYDSIEKDLPINCRLVGIATRISQSKLGYKPKVEIRWNLELYDSLGNNPSTNNSTRVINQAAILLHELLYIMCNVATH